MADFEPPSFSLGLDFGLSDSEPQITPVTQDTDPSSSNQFSVAFSMFKDKDDEFETLVVDDSEPEYPDSHPKLKRLRRGGATSSPSPVLAKVKPELHSTAVINDEHINVFCLQQDSRTDQHLHAQHQVVCASSNDQEPISASCNNTVFPKLNASPLRGFHSTDSDLYSYDPIISKECNGSDDDVSQHVKRKKNVSNAQEDLPNAYHYFFHDDPRIRELVRNRLPNFSPSGTMLNIDLEQPSTSKIDYIGQFRGVESSKQAARTIKDRTNSRKLKTEEMSQGWVNPKLGVDKVKTKRAVKRKVHTARQTAGHWLTDSDGKKIHGSSGAVFIVVCGVYIGKSGQELTGRVAYIQYKKESGLRFRKVKRKSVTKKKK